jgi:hypothetical protein
MFMFRLFALSVLYLLVSCEKAEVKSYHDLIADDALMVVMSSNEKDLTMLLSSQLKSYLLLGKLAFPYIDADREIAFVVTDFNNFKAYAALPIAKKSQENVLKAFPEWLREKSELRNGYLFVPVRGELPSSYGGSSLKPDGSFSLELLVDVEKGMKENEDSYKNLIHKNGLLLHYLNITPKFRDTIAEIMDESGLAILQEMKQFSCKVSRSEKISVTSEMTFIEGSSLASGMKSMASLKLPENTYKKSVKISSSLNFKDCDPFVDVFQDVLKMFLRNAGKKSHLLPVSMIRNDIESAGDFSLVCGFNSAELPLVDFVVKSAAKYEGLSKYLKSLTTNELSPEVNGEMLYCGTEQAIYDSPENGLVKIFIDLNIEETIKNQFLVGVNNLWIQLKKRMSARANNSMAKSIINNLQPISVDFSTLEVKIQSEKNALKINLDF